MNIFLLMISVVLLHQDLLGMDKRYRNPEIMDIFFGASGGNFDVLIRHNPGSAQSFEMIKEEPERTNESSINNNNEATSFDVNSNQDKEDEAKAECLIEQNTCDKYYVKVGSSDESKNIKIKKEYPCTYSGCCSKFTHPGNLSRHKNRTHEKKRKYPCQKCSKTFYCSGDFRDHNRTHLGKPHKCKTCGHGFLRPYLLKRHKKICKKKRSKSKGR